MNGIEWYHGLRIVDSCCRFVLHMVLHMSCILQLTEQFTSLFFTLLLLMDISSYESYCTVKQLKPPLDYIHIERHTD